VCCPARFSVGFVWVLPGFLERFYWSARVGDNWLVLTQSRERTWHLQVWGDTPLEAEVTAEDEAQAKDNAVAATVIPTVATMSRQNLRSLPMSVR
jgi:hypothetical protein